MSHLVLRWLPTNIFSGGHWGRHKSEDPKWMSGHRCLGFSDRENSTLWACGKGLKSDDCVHLVAQRWTKKRGSPKIQTRLKDVGDYLWAVLLLFLGQNKIHFVDINSCNDNTSISGPEHPQKIQKCLWIILLALYICLHLHPPRAHLQFDITVMVSWLTFLELYTRLQRIAWFPSLKKQLTNPLR